MVTIATLTQKADGNLEGTLSTFNVTAPIALIPNDRKARDNEPGLPHRLTQKRLRTRCRLEPDFEEHRRAIDLDVVAAPEFGTIYGYVVPAPGGDPTKKGIIWNPAG